jgi:hypothetical protein
MTELNVLYGGNDDNFMGDNLENAYQLQKNNKISNNETLLYTEDKASKAQQYNPNVPMQSSQSSVQSQQTQQMPSQMPQQMPQQPQQPQQVAQPYYSNSQYDNRAKNYNLLDNSQYVNVDNYRRKGNEYNFFDRMSAKRTEVVKLALFSLVIVLGISIDRMLTYYLSKYIGENILTDFQELLLRLSYPITIFLLLWVFKAF